MTYCCINCNKMWNTDNKKINDISHGLCKNCAKHKLKPLYRAKQLKEGNFDCFARSNNFCDQYECKYRYLCLV